ncbi:MAG: BadF/BadG/BcrA/BcrD ATPase family protein [Acidobacteriaceae bacterium]|nr:BadF/BadG/BcrA/BcrD ATPase family protein [Acidobacteriaceae bacterium]
MFVAIDAGGTSTRCWVADERQVLGRSRCETVKLMHVGEALATERMRALVHSALQEAGSSPGEVEAACVGLAGVSIAEVRQWCEGVMQQLCGIKPQVVGDEEIAFEAAWAGGPGILVIAGTGSNVLGRCANGFSVTGGGWGPMLGDEGAGFWIGLEGLRAALRARDRGQVSTILDAAQEFWRLGSLAELVGYANLGQRPHFGELAQVVSRCAEEGDAVATEVLSRGGAQLASLVRLVSEKMLASGAELEEARRVAFAGSVLDRIGTVRRAFLAGLPEFMVADSSVEPLEGALWLARRGALRTKWMQ